MIRQFLVGGAVSAVNIGLHALVMMILIEIARKASERSNARESQHLVLVMIPTVLVLMLTHATEIIVWALAYWLVDATPPEADRVYFAFVNYTTLGYGDVVPVKRWNLLGPITAMNGVLLFGWSTAVIFEVLRGAMREAGIRPREWD
jgi:chromate transport protein ChrA